MDASEKALMETNDELASILQETLDHLKKVTQGQLQARIGVPDEAGWVTGQEILQDPGKHFPDYLDHLTVALGADSRKVVASFFLKDWLRQVVLASTGCYLLQQRIPDISFRNVAFHVSDEGRVNTIAFLEDRVIVVEGDNAAGCPGVRVVADDGLRDELRDMLAWNFVAPIIETLRPFVPVGDRFLWATTADTVAGFILLLGQRLNLPAGYRAEADALAGMEPLKGKTASIEVSVNGHRVPVLVRGCCCFAYHLEQYEHCKTCPLLPPETRLENIRRDLLAGSG